MKRQALLTVATLLCTLHLPVPGLAQKPASSAERPDAGEPAALLGTWRGTSTCTDRVVAPACRDEVVVYDFTPGARAGIVHWKADKIVGGQREPMGELDLEYDGRDTCWKYEFTAPRFHGVWCLAVDGPRMSGTLRSIPGRETVRKVEARRD